MTLPGLVRRNGIRKPDGHRAAVAGLSLASAVTAAVLSRHVFPLLSINNDEAINRLQADAIAHGNLFVPAPGAPDAFRPWLAAVRGGDYVLKYTPVVPAMMAASQIVTGGLTPYLALVAGAVVVFTYLLASEVLGDRTEALVATALFACSPLVIVQSGLLLSYLPTLLLLEVFAWSLLRGLDRDRRRLLALSGLAVGLAFFARSFDALVFAAPVLVGAVVLRRRRLSAGAIAVFLAPAAVTLGAFLAFNKAATGSALKLPFSLLEPKDALGFGVRRLYPTDSPHEFGLREGLAGLLGHGALLNVWVAGGSLLLVLALVTVLRRRIRGAGWSLVTVGGLLPLSYLAFWGPWNATELWGGTRYVGPFYFLPVVLPVALFGGRGLVEVCRRRPRLGAAATVAVVAVTVASLAVILPDNLAFTRSNQALARLVAGRSPRELVFTTLPAPFLMHPTAVVGNRWDLSGPVVYAVERGDADLDAARTLPGHTPFRLRFGADFVHPGQALNARLEQLRLAAGERLEVGVAARPPPASGAVAVEVTAGGVASLYALGEAASYDERLLVDGRGAQLVGRQPASVRQEPGRPGLEVRLVRWPPGPGTTVPLATERFPVQTAGPLVEALVPTGAAWTTGSPRPPVLALTA